MNAKNIIFNDDNVGVIELKYLGSGSYDDASLEYKIFKEDNPSESFSFTVNYSFSPNNISNINTINTIHAYPNPANNNVSISYNASTDSEILLYNIVGEQVGKYNINAGTDKLDIDVSNLSSGTYFYSIISDSKASETKRLVIKH